MANDKYDESVVWDKADKPKGQKKSKYFALWDVHAKTFVGAPTHLFEEEEEAELFASRLNFKSAGTAETGHSFWVVKIEVPDPPPPPEPEPEPKDEKKETKAKAGASK